MTWWHSVRYIAIVVSTAACCGFSGLSATAGGVEDADTASAKCHDLAGARHNGRGVGWDQLDTERAIAACRLALEILPANPSLQAYLARAYRKAEQYDLALSFARSSAQADDPAGMAILGFIYRDGNGVEKDDAEAVHWFKAGSARGNADAQFGLAYMYGQGRGVEKDLAAAARIYRLSAEQGHPTAQNNLGTQFEHGEGVEKSLADAVAWYRLAAEQGYARAQENLGTMYARGHGVTQNHLEAVRWYRRAADQGFASAEVRLGYAYSNGQGVEQDHGQAALWYHRAADQGLASARYNLARAYQLGQGVEPDIAEAIKLYRLAAAQGLAVAQLSLGHLYKDGNGLQQDFAKAAEWYRLAADQDNARAQNNLGVAYINGRGVDKNVEEAVRLIRLAADQDDSQAQSNLGKLYEQGLGVPEDKREAARLFRLSSDQGVAEAQFDLADLYSRGEGVGQNDAAAARLFTAAAQQGHAQAQLRLGACFEFGYGIGADETEALRWYRTAAAQSVSAAYRGLARIAARRIGQGDGRGVAELVQELIEAASLHEVPEAQLALAAASRQGVLSELADKEKPLIGAALDSGGEEALRLTTAVARGEFGLELAADGMTRLRRMSAEGNTQAGAMLVGALALYGDFDGSLQTLSKLDAALDIPLNSDSLYLLSKLLHDQTVLPPASDSPRAAWRLLLALADRSNVQAVEVLGDLLRRKRLDPDQITTSEKYQPSLLAALQGYRGYWRMASAEDGDVNALRQARADLQTAAPNNDAAASWLAWMQWHGLGGPRDKVAALEAAKAVSVSSNDAASLTLRAVAGTDSEDAERQQALVRAAVLNSGPAAYLLGLGHRDGERMPRSVDTARHWFAVAAEFGWMPASAALKQLPREPAGDALSLRGVGRLVDVARENVLEALRERVTLSTLRERVEWSASVARLAGLHAEDFAWTELRLQVDSLVIERGRAVETPLILALERSCVWGKRSAAARRAGFGGVALAYAKAAVNELQAARQALAGLDESLRGCFAAAVSNHYRWLADLLIEQGRLPQAEAVLGQLKDFETYEFVRRAQDFAGRSGEVLALSDSERSVVAKAGDFNAVLAKARRLRELEEAGETLDSLQAAELEKLAVEVDDLYAAFESWRSEFRDAVAALDDGHAEAVRERQVRVDEIERSVQPALATIEASTGERAAAVHAVVLSDRMHFIVTSAEARALITIDQDFSREALRWHVVRFRQALQDLSADPKQAAQVIYDRLFVHVDRALRDAGASLVLVSFDDALRYLPMAALFDGQGYLLQRYRFARLSSGPLTGGTSKPDALRVVGFGATRGSNDGRFSPLPAVAREIDIIVREEGEPDENGILPGKSYLDDRFGVGSLRAALGGAYPSQIAHIASHFHLDSESDEASFLLLGDGSNLSLARLIRSRWSRGLRKLELLTLSACETGVTGEDDDGREVDSLAAIFLRKGTGAVMSTLWPIADEATSLFMANFYGNLRKGVDMQRALNSAQRAFVDAGAANSGIPEQLAHPYFWAPFVLSGRLH